MNTATTFPLPPIPKTESAGSGFRSIFEHAPFAVARCNPQGLILEMNPIFKRSLDPELTHRPALRLGDLFSLADRATAESALRDLFANQLESVSMEGTFASVAQSSAGPGGAKWTAWRVSGSEPAHALLIAERRDSPSAAVEETLLQAQRWEAVGRLAGGVVHDFNNLLTGVMLYTDLLLSSIDSRDRRRRYADEIRSAILQATGLVRQLLVFARPQKVQVRSLCLNQIAGDMKDLLSRLIGENIAIEFKLDPDLGLLKIDQAQAQQIILNLVLNARDAMPRGGRILVETSNCRFQTVAGATLAQQGVPAFPCILLSVADNGCGMDETTRQRLFEPFFTTKNAGKGTGLGLTTVRSIVTSHHGLIHVESQPGKGTRVMIVLPRSSQTADAVFLDAPAVPAEAPSPKFQVLEKETLL